METAAAFETFPALDALPGIAHAFTRRVSGFDVKVDRDIALQRLDDAQRAIRKQIGVATRPCIIGEQIHAAAVAIVDAATAATVPGADGLITADPRVCLGVHVADCAPVFLIHPARRVIALVHSGRRGTELGVVPAAIARLVADFGCDPAGIVAQIGPCIRPPHYETDFAAAIVAQCRAAGLVHIHDCGTCTATHVDRYYSYRAERGKTGRLLGLLALR